MFKLKKSKPFITFNIAQVFWGILILSSLLLACGGKEPIRVGFIGGLTGKLSAIGVGGRDGVTLAVEEINDKGGIEGQKLKLLTKDDKQNRAQVQKSVRELVREKVVAIIGPMTSDMTVAAVAVANKENIILISPTASTDALTGLDDALFRVSPPRVTQTLHIARHAYKETGLRSISIIYDLSNRAFTEGFYTNFRTAFEKSGGAIDNDVPYSTGPEASFPDLVKELLKGEPDGLLIITGAPDAALICQHLRRSGSKIPILSSAWAMTPDLLKLGGPAVEGVIFSVGYNETSREKAFLDFKQRFKNRFGTDPGFPAVHGYEAAQLLFKALLKNNNPQQIKQTLLRLSVIQGLQAEIRMNKFGDPIRKRFITTVKDGKFLTE